MLETAEQFEGLMDDLVRLLPVHVADETYAAGIMFLVAVIEPL
jgi:hypothetical protein